MGTGKKIQKFNQKKFPEIKNRIFSWNQGRLQSIDTKGLQCKRETKINKESSRSRNILMNTLNFSYKGGKKIKSASGLSKQLIPKIKTHEKDQENSLLN